MPPLGLQLKAARERKGVTASQAAAATRMKVQSIEALEREEFDRIPAPMYVKGFIKIYAEYLDLDPAPLLQEYQRRHAPPEPPLPAAQKVLRSPSGAKVLQPKTERSRTADLATLVRRLPPDLPRRLALGAGAVVLLFVAGLGLRQCAHRPPAAAAQSPSVQSSATGLPWVVVREPPEPYLKKAK